MWYSSSVWADSNCILATQIVLTKVCDAQESKSRVTGWPFAKNIPAITDVPVVSSGICMLATHPVLTVPFFFWLAWPGCGVCTDTGAGGGRRGCVQSRAKWPGLPQL